MSGELLVIAGIVLLALFWLIPNPTRGIVHLLKRIFSGFKDRY